MRKLLLLALIPFALSSHAAVKGTYRLEDGKQLQLIYLDPQRIRMTMGEEAQLVLRDGTTWMLSKQAGQWMAMDLKSMGGLMQAVRRPAAIEDQKADEVSMRSLGRTETVAGYEGEVWEIRSGEERYEVVLSDHPDVRELTEGWRYMAEKLASSFGVEAAQQLQEALAAMPARQTGLLRQGNNMILIGIETDVTASDADMPPGTTTMQMPSIPGLN
ncbi:MAG: DUF4412 domain-containing protein [Spongiibacteraceae bacterium]|jgi:hypothetical protein|nr:DUF4412 domain-containing protein [Spongiibacteraceae bacterium]